MGRKRLSWSNCHEALGNCDYNSCMLSFIIQATQQAQQVAPNVYVTVQQPPPGMPEWVKIIISAGVGSAFAIAGSVVMEFVKPKILHRTTRKIVEENLTEEVWKNRRFLFQAMRDYEDGLKNGTDGATLLTSLREWVNYFTKDRFNYFMSAQKALVYELDTGGLLTSMYESIDEAVERAKGEDLERIYKAMSNAHHHSVNYLIVMTDKAFKK